MTCLSERALMRTLEGGCSVPIGVNTKLEKDTLWMHGLVASLDGQNVIEYQETISLVDADTREKREAVAEELGVRVATLLYKRGADKILQELAHRSH